MSKPIIIAMLICISFTLADDPKKSCPKYSCNKIENLCAKSTYNTTDLYSNVVVGDKCSKEGEYCIKDEDKTLHPNDLNEWFSSASSDHSMNCSTYEVKPYLKYPGEACKVDDDCYGTDKDRCKEGKCKAPEGPCKGNEDCLVGNYCKVASNVTESKCEKQIAVGKDGCVNSWDCVNNAVCQKGKCIEAFSLKVGEKIESKDKEINDLYCEFGKSKDGTCVQTVNAKSNDRIVACELNQKCSYNITGIEGSQVEEVECDCGYNKDGKGYCPIAHKAGKYILI
jgi:hypothetical protein